MASKKTLPPGSLEKSDSNSSGSTSSSSRGAANARAQTPSRRKLKREEKSQLIRESLFRSAGEVVGEMGYGDASIALITSKAGVAQGTFYNYFDTRQEILDQLLPTLGHDLLSIVGEAQAEGNNFSESEERGFRAFLTFLDQVPQFFRILNEARNMAPIAHERHLKMVAKGYKSFLQKFIKSGEIKGFDERELDVIVYVLMAARSYIPMLFEDKERTTGETTIPEWSIRAYMKFICYGLLGRPPSVDSDPGSS